MTPPIGPRIGQTQRPQPSPASLNPNNTPDSAEETALKLALELNKAQQSALTNQINTMSRLLTPPRDVNGIVFYPRP